MSIAQELEAKKQRLEKKQTDLFEWLVRNWNHPDRSKIIQDRNQLSVELKTVRYQLEQLAKGEPILGYDIGLDTKRISQEIKKTNIQY